MLWESQIRHKRLGRLSGSSKMFIGAINTIEQRFLSMKVSVLGCGCWGKNLVRNFYQLNALGMVCDMTPAGRALARQIAPDVPIVESVEQVLS
jgi:hypothetical protein